MPDVLRTATLKIRTPKIVIENRWTDPGDNDQKHKLTIEVEQIEIDSQGYRKGATIGLAPIVINPAASDVATRMVTYQDPVTGDTITTSTGGISTAIETWIAALLDERFPA